MNENREKLHKILDAVLDANGLEERTREKTGLKPTVFFSFSGHVAKFEIQVFDNGWFAGEKKWKEFSVKTDDCITDAKVAEICEYLRAVALPKAKENALAQIIQGKKDNIEKEMRELEKLKNELKELQGGEANEC